MTSFGERIEVITSHLTHDSGIHTMSSRRDSAFSDSALPYSHNLYSNPYVRRTNSDCLPSENLYQPGRLAHSMEHLRTQNYEPVPCHSDQRAYTGSYNNKNEQMSVFSNCGSNYEPINNRFSYHEIAASVSQCTQNCCPPAEPGGGGIINHIIHTTPSIHSHHSDSHPHFSEATGNYINNYTPSSHTHEILKPLLNNVENIPRSQNLFQAQLCSKRLLPTRHQTKNAILSILEDGEVCIEFIKKRGHLKREMVCEVMKISSDGLRIILYEPEGGKGAPVSNEPAILPPQGADKIYSIENLPEKHWKKYMYAFKFVDLVRAKTPKVTYYTDKAKILRLLFQLTVQLQALLFGNNSNTREKRVTIPGIGMAFQLPNGEVRVRYQDGSQIWVDGKHHVRYQYPEGHIVNYLDSESIPRPIMEKLQHMPKVLKHLMPSPVSQKIHNLR
ncbi:hypothetical protein NQ314_013410 [Rhamnusium bicolor]|uniref:Uncharacterized protein n=1 Tax=Rhamnusium bicolor TaxID=1586634 RepID=A0AAV8X751_9CUCU|nr:hypothetical protein NQ314_013410 [Rhamnusium bicolor]